MKGAAGDGLKVGGWGRGEGMSGVHLLFNYTSCVCAFCYRLQALSPIYHRMFSYSTPIVVPENLYTIFFFFDAVFLYDFFFTLT